MVKSKMTNELK